MKSRRPPKRKAEPFRVLVADPPWSFNDKLPGPGRGAEKHYDVMDLDGIKNFKLPPLADDCYLFMWRVSSQVPEAYEVVKAWGFHHKSEIVWEKLTKHGKPWFGMGHHVRAAHETAIIAVRGSPKPLVRNIRSRFAAKVPEGRHSAKPEEFFDIVEAMCQGPFVELFARRHRPGWSCRGNEL